MKDIYQQHPKWDKLKEICATIQRLKEKAETLREEIDNDLFGKKGETK